MRRADRTLSGGPSGLPKFFCFPARRSPVNGVSAPERALLPARWTAVPLFVPAPAGTCVLAGHAVSVAANVPPASAGARVLAGWLTPASEPRIRAMMLPMTQRSSAVCVMPVRRSGQNYSRHKGILPASLSSGTNFISPVSLAPQPVPSRFPLPACPLRSMLAAKGFCGLPPPAAPIPIKNTRYTRGLHQPKAVLDAKRTALWENSKGPSTVRTVSPFI